MSARKSTKKYTNETWTKRVDHEAGKHRPGKAEGEPLVCQVCGDFYFERRWWLPDSEGVARYKNSIDPKWSEPMATVCPACERKKNGVPSGYVHLDGAFLTQHREEIDQLLHNEAGRAAEDNPLARIMNWSQDEKGRLTLETTTEHLAQRLGHALEKAFKGQVRYDFSHENKLAHVYWVRD